MGQALYRKHRPKRLSEIVGQEHITSTLEQALKQGRISHAYLFTGPRGVGKTSTARILAHEINNLPYTDDSQHMDIIEIDAASNRRIDEIRELRDKVYMAPTSAKYKVYIIDEVHMLTREAFNALLKTLEEPPAHVVFILATTDAHKLPETIISRTQRFSFRPADKAKAIAHLKSVAEQEKITVSPEALELLAEHGDGSFRDSMSLLDQASSHGKKLDAAGVQSLLGIPSVETVEALLEQVSAGGAPAQIITTLNDMYDQGYQAAAIAKQLGRNTRAKLIAQQLSLSSEAALALLGKLLAVPAAHDPERFLEIVLLQSRPATVTAIEFKPPTITPANPPIIEKAAVPSPPADTKPKKEAKVAAKPKSEAKETKEVKAAATPAGDFDESIWPVILGLLKQKYNTLYSVVRMAQPTFVDENTLQLAFAFAFHQKRINEAGNRQKLSDVIFEAVQRPIAIECIVDKGAQAPAIAVAPAAVAPKPDISAISNIFGGGELLES
ncbi:MAG: polymerase subunit gamma/tau [Candidatus Saccharibacteria bacterium]|nr:polymerase subunit gamma/tau [Candidatus Saccharibacteria bacterium]